MAFELAGIDAPYIGSSNVTALTYSGNPPAYSSGGIPQFYAVQIDAADGTVGAATLCVDANTLPLGVAQDGPATGTGQDVRVRISGYTKVVVAAAVNVGDKLSCTTGGKVTPAAAAGATNTYVIGVAETSATQSGDTVTMRLTIGAATQVNA